MALTFLVGGARSGKSRFAVELGRRHESAGGAVRFVATAPRLDDDDWSRRIARHVAERPAWPTIEAPTDITAALADAGEDLVIVDCLTLWVSNLMYDGVDDDSIAVAAERLAATASDRAAPTIIVSNEVGLGIHPDNELGRRFRDVLGAANQQIGAAASRSLFFVAGRAVPLAAPLDLVPTEL